MHFVLVRCMMGTQSGDTGPCAWASCKQRHPGCNLLFSWVSCRGKGGRLPTCIHLMTCTSSSHLALQLDSKNWNNSTGNIATATPPMFYRWSQDVGFMETVTVHLQAYSVNNLVILLLYSYTQDLWRPRLNRYMTTVATADSNNLVTLLLCTCNNNIDHGVCYYSCMVTI